MSLSMEEDVTDLFVGTGNTGRTFRGRGGGAQRRYVMLVEAAALSANSTKEK